MKPGLILLSLLVSAAASWAQTATPDCPTTTLVAGESATGALAATDCRVRDMITGSTNASYAKRYRLVVESQGVFPVTITSPDFPAAVSLYAGTVLRGQATALQGATGRFTINLPPGTYTLYAFTTRADATGNFELKADRQEARSCTTGTLEPTGNLEGAFTESGCRFVDLTAFSVSTAYVNFYQLDTTSRGVLQFTAETAIPNFSTVLSSSAGGAAFRALKQMTVSLLPGANVISVSSALAGSYTIRTELQELRACPLAPAKIGEETTGELTSAGCRWLDVFVPSDDASPSSLLRFTVDARTIAQVDLRSTAFDSFLVLLTSSGGLIGLNDDVSSTVLDSRVLAHLPPGNYVAMATSADGDGLGAFTLKLGSESPRKCDAVKLTSGEAASGTFPEGDTGCRLIDYMNYSTLLTPVAPFVFEPAEATMFGLKVEGATSGTVRVLTAAGQEAIRGAADRNGDVNTEFRVPAAPSTVLVTSTATPRPAFKVTAQARSIPSCAADPLEFGPEVESVLTTVECKVSEIGNYLPLPTPAKTFRVKVTERGTLRVLVVSTEFGPFAAVVEVATGNALGSGAVPGNTGLLNLTGPVEPGEYTVAVSSLGVALGAFKVQATFVPAGGVTAPVLTGGESAGKSASWPRMTRDDAYCGPMTRMEANVRSPVFNWCTMLPLESTSSIRRPR